MATPAPTEKHPGDEFIHAGGGAGLVLIQLSAIIPGLLPIIGLGALFAAVFVVPLMALTLVGALLFAVPWSMWRAVSRSRRRRDDPRVSR